MDPDLAVHDLSEVHVVLELHERLTAPGPGLELHVVVTERGETTAWWEDENGTLLAPAIVGEA